MSGQKIAVCVGINDYPGTANDLKGCVNDAKTWSDLLKNKFGFKDITLLLDRQATHGAVTQALKKMIAKAKSGDSIVFTYSGHGTSVADRDGDEVDGRDEALCLYDKYLIDDEIRAILSQVKDGVKFTIISDSCHSGTVTRMQMSTTGKDGYMKPRYLPPADDAEAMLLARLPVKGRVFSEDNMKEILISGCKSTEYSYDAYLGGRAQGAMTYFASQVILSDPNLSYEEFYAKLRKGLPSSEYPQTPQLEGSQKNRRQKVILI